MASEITTIEVCTIMKITLNCSGLSKIFLSFLSGEAFLASYQQATIIRIMGMASSSTKSSVSLSMKIVPVWSMVF